MNIDNGKAVMLGPMISLVCEPRTGEHFRLNVDLGIETSRTDCVKQVYIDSDVAILQQETLRKVLADEKL